MTAEERRVAITKMLSAADGAISGRDLSKEFGVSRQIIVQDIAVLKERGHDIISTHFGYILQRSTLIDRVFKLKHTSAETEDELYTIVDMGGEIEDVFVWHKVYGKVRVPLGIRSRLHAAHFLEGVRTGKSTELMHITGGYHYHTIRAESKAVLDEIYNELDKKGYIAPEI